MVKYLRSKKKAFVIKRNVVKQIKINLTGKDGGWEGIKKGIEGEKN